MIVFLEGLWVEKTESVRLNATRVFMAKSCRHTSTAGRVPFGVLLILHLLYQFFIVFSFALVWIREIGSVATCDL
jgi:hypothetical protein